MHLNTITIHCDRFPTRKVFPFNLPIFREPQELSFRRPVALFVGENGSGKSTLLAAIARRCGTSIWDRPRRHLAHNNPYEEELYTYLTLTWADGRAPGSLFRAETFRDLADFFDDVSLCDPGRLSYQGGRILNVLSHGESFLAYFRGRFQKRGLFFLDEPEAALSPASQIQFLTLLRQVEGMGEAQFVIATHSPILLSYPGAQIFSFDHPRIEEVACEDTMHYRIYQRFFADRAAVPNVNRI